MSDDKLFNTLFGGLATILLVVSGYVYAMNARVAVNSSRSETNNERLIRIEAKLDAIYATLINKESVDGKKK